MVEKHIDSLIEASARPLLSFEFFPPKHHRAFAALEQSVGALHEMEPDFVTVTYGAGGTTRARTLVLCDLLKDMGFAPIMPHLTCVGSSRNELKEIADDIYARGYRNIMTLRGDPPEGDDTFTPAPDGLSYAGELVELLKKWHPDLCCGVAAYPETHPEAESPDHDVAHLKAKLDVGGAFATTQLFLENEYFYSFKERCNAAGITKPILPGLMPALSLKQAERMMSLSKSSFPAALREGLEKAGGEGPEAERVGIDWLVRQIDDLIAHGVPGIHLYILNRAKTVFIPELKDCIHRWHPPGGRTQ
jgi:methylenetetrahydrofolate reductase (NADPH)